MRHSLAALLLLAGFSTGCATNDVKSLRFYIGTYTGGESEGIYVSELDLATGALAEPRLASAATNPSFVALHPNGRYLYAVGEVSDFDGKKTGAVSAFAIDRETGLLTLLNQQPSRGTGPCYVVVDAAGKNVLVANYGGGSVAALPIGADGRLDAATGFVQHTGSSVNQPRQAGPHAHSINLDAANRFAVAADLGLDKLLVYRFDPTAGTLTPNDPPATSVAAGAGPRHFAFHPNGRFAYVINEMNLTVTAFRYDAGRGTLTAIHSVSTLPAGTEKQGSTAEVQVHPSGRFLYGSNRGHDSLAIFAIDQNSGHLTPIGHHSTGGKTPRNFAIDPTGRYILAENQNSNSVVVLRIDPDTGLLSNTGHTITVGSPVCIKFLPPGA